MQALALADFYKTGHPRMMPPNTSVLYSNTTPRKSRKDGINSVVVFGIQYFIKKYLIKEWNNTFFNLPKEEAVSSYERLLKHTVGENVIVKEQIEYLHDLGHLPIKLKALPEGTLCPIQVPLMTITNTDKKCAWIVNYLETLSQTVTWLPITSATIARQYKKLLNKYANETSSIPEFVDWQAHDFSMRGMSSVESCMVNGASHLTSFTGTDSIPAIPFLEEYYGADIEKELVGGSVFASEHSQQCAYYIEGSKNEAAYVNAILDAVPDDAIVSIVCDGFDFWKFLTETLPLVKDRIMARAGKVVCRPDSGDPIKIICGYFLHYIDKTSEEYLNCFHRTTNQIKWFDVTGCDAIQTSDNKYFDKNGHELTQQEVEGALHVLGDIFNLKENNKGYFELDPHIGLIYGDSITIERCETICEQLKSKLFATTNVVFGIGSYTYQYNTRDTFGLACKATYTVIDGESKNIFKDPATDSGMKKSAKGLLRVNKVEGTHGSTLELQQECTELEEEGGELKTVFLNGEIIKGYTLQEIRDRLKNNPL